MYLIKQKMDIESESESGHELTYSSVCYTSMVHENANTNTNTNTNTYTNTSRPNWDDYFKEIVSVTAKRSSCERLQVGCILVKDNRIVSQGYNGFMPGCPHQSIIRDNHEQATVHAEQNAITDCAKRGVSCDQSVAYITHFPCIICMRLLISSGIHTIKYIHDYNNDELVYEFARMSGVRLIQLM